MDAIAVIIDEAAAAAIRSHSHRVMKYLTKGGRHPAVQGSRPARTWATRSLIPPLQSLNIVISTTGCRQGQVILPLSSTPGSGQFRT